MYLYMFVVHHVGRWIVGCPHRYILSNPPTSTIHPQSYFRWFNKLICMCGNISPEQTIIGLHLSAMHIQFPSNVIFFFEDLLFAEWTDCLKWWVVTSTHPHSPNHHAAIESHTWNGDKNTDNKYCYQFSTLIVCVGANQFFKFIDFPMAHTNENFEMSHMRERPR